MSTIINGTSGNDTINGGSLDEFIYGLGGNDIINGGDGNDTLDGGADMDTMYGGLGNDSYYVDQIGDVIVEEANAGTDTVLSSVSYTLGANVENLTLTQAGRAGTGNDLNNVLTAGVLYLGLTDVLDGKAGADTMTGGHGSDIYYVDDTGDVVVEAVDGSGDDTVISSIDYSLVGKNVESLTLTGGGLVGTGNASNNTYTISHSDNIIIEAANGGTDTVISSASFTLGANVENLTLTGANLVGTGNGLNNTYTVSYANNVIVEEANAGTDTVLSSVSYTLGANVENLTLTQAACAGTGNDLNNVLTAGVLYLGTSDVLDGKAGADTMTGGHGNDIYYVDDVGDVVVEAANGTGDDTVISSIDYSLEGKNVESLTLTGGGLVGTGNASNNTYTISHSDNIIIEAANGGTDTVISSASFTLGANVENLTLTGANLVGTGNELNNTYTVSYANDVIVEEANAGTDTVLSSVSYTLGANVENLTLTQAACAGTGNDLNNVLTAGVLYLGTPDVLDGKAGADTMTGGHGSDIYYVDDAGDVVVEAVDGTGDDKVFSSINYSLQGKNVENLTLTGTDAINGTGSALNNVLVGNVANNILDGGAGADAMSGGAGDDTYVVDNMGDTVTEAVNAGTDTVKASLTYTLGANIENLTLTGATAINGTGNTFDNIINGNDGANVLDGGLGADTLAGGMGSDTLRGGVGDDRYIFNLGDGVDRIEGIQGSDTLFIGSNLTENDLECSRVGNDFVIGIVGTEDAVVLADWFGQTEGVNYAEFSNGTILDRVALEALLGRLIGTPGNDVLTGTPGDDRMYGLAGNDTMSGLAGNDLLDGGTGIDNMMGGTGDDTYVVDVAGDVVSENVDQGTDTVLSSITYTLGANVENLILDKDAGATNGTGNVLNNELSGNGANNVLDGGAGVDTLSGGGGNDTYYMDNTADVASEGVDEGTDTVISTHVSYTLGANVENLTLVQATGMGGTGGGMSGTGNALDNVLTVSNYKAGQGYGGSDVLNGGAGADTMSAGNGSDVYYVDNAGDVVVDIGGTDTIYSSVSYTVSANVENMTLTGASNINATGNTLNNALTGNGGDNVLDGGVGNDVLDGGAGADTMIGGTDNDTYVVYNLSDIVIENANEGTDTAQSYIDYALGMNMENVTLLGVADINATGNELDNVLTGNSGVNTLSGGLGNDTYYVQSTTDVASEGVDEGTDTVISTHVSYTLGANVENLTLVQATGMGGTGGGMSGTGNALDNVLTVSNYKAGQGYGGSDVLNGGAGADTMSAGNGTDIYYVDNAGDVVVDIGGVDKIYSSVSYTVSANVENMTLTGASNINATGNTLNNALTGNGGDNVLDGGVGNDVLDGGAGADTMIGGTDNDNYVVHNIEDIVIENANEGTDTAQSYIDYALGMNVENVTLLGVADINATGNELDNVLTGNSGVNTLSGGLGNDTYYVQNTADVATEGVDEGTDTVISTHVSYTLGANVENLTLVQATGMGWGGGGMSGTGNALDNVLTVSNYKAGQGYGGSDVLNGGAGADTMSAGNGTDIYYVDNAGDVVVDIGGVDKIYSSVSYTVSANVENMTLTGASNINATGNTLNNVLTGNGGANQLVGGAGNDTLYGETGNDVLEGTDGNDTLSDTGGNNLFNGGTGTDILTGSTGNELFIGGAGNDTITTGSGADIIAFNQGDGQDTVVASIGADNTLSLGGGIDYLSLAMSKSGNNLVLTAGSGDQITMQDWFAGTGNHSITNLQIVLDATVYDSNSTDPLLNQQIQSFDFALLAQNFDQALAGNPALTSWSMTDALLSAHLEGSDTAALGGDLAYQYNLNGTLAGIGVAAAQAVLGDPSFGVSPQQLQPLAELQTGVARLG